MFFPYLSWLTDKNEKGKVNYLHSLLLFIFCIYRDICYPDTISAELWDRHSYRSRTTGAVLPLLTVICLVPKQPSLEQQDSANRHCGKCWVSLSMLFVLPLKAWQERSLHLLALVLVQWGSEDSIWADFWYHSLPIFKTWSLTLSRKSHHSKGSQLTAGIAARHSHRQATPAPINVMYLPLKFTANLVENTVSKDLAWDFPSHYKQYVGLYPPLEAEGWSIYCKSKSTLLFWSGCSDPGSPGCHSTDMANVQAAFLAAQIITASHLVEALCTCVKQT